MRMILILGVMVLGFTACSNKKSVELQYMIFRKPDTIRNEKKS